MAKMTNTKSLVAGALLKWIVSAALLIVYILLYTSFVFYTDDPVLVIIGAIAMLVPSAISFALYYSWYNKYVPKYTNDGTGRVDVPTSGLLKSANSKTVTAIIVNLAFAIAGVLAASFIFGTYVDIKLVALYLVGSAIVFSAIDFVIFHIGMFKPNN